MEQSRVGILATIGTAVLLLLSLSAFSQRQIKGVVIDSLTFAPIANVNVSLKNSSRGTSTDVRGEFRLLVKPTDTLVFTLVGYYSEAFAAFELEETTLIRMTEQVRILNTVTVMPKNEAKPARGIHLAPSGKLMNYGPSTAGVNFAYFTKEQRERRKLNRVIAEHDRTRNYVAVVTSPEVRERIIFDNKLTEDEYYQILAAFNIENGDFYYNLSEEELIVVMGKYFRENAHQR